MLVVGLTGGIGSGKTTVASLFAERGVPIIDADEIAHAITKPGLPAFKAIIEHFGQQIILPSGRLDRTQLRHLIFTNSIERRWLEELLHPIIRQEMENQIHALSAPYCLAVIPLLLEVEFYYFINRILVVDASKEAQLNRIMARDNSPKTQVEAILKSQASREARLAKANDIIKNNGTLSDLIPQVERLHQLYLRLANN